MALGALSACYADRASGSLPTATLTIDGVRLEMELALTSESRLQGLGGREAVGRHEGMILVLPAPVRTGAVMRDMAVAIDVAFLDVQGRVLAVYTMPTEPPRRPGESDAEYEARLPQFRSPAPAQFVLEVAAGRLAELSVMPGDRLDLDWQALARRAY